MAEEGEDWNWLELMTILKSLAIFFKTHEGWRSSFNLATVMKMHVFCRDDRWHYLYTVIPLSYIRQYKNKKQL